MTITKHAVERFRERVTDESTELIHKFIIRDIEKSEIIYTLNGNEEKREVNGLIYIVKKNKFGQKIVVTVFLKEEL